MQFGRPGFNPWVRKIPWRREWQSTPVFLPGKSHGQRRLAGCSPGGRKELDMTEQLNNNLSSTFFRGNYTSRVFFNITVQKHQFFGTRLSLKVQLSHPYMAIGKTIALTRWTFVSKVMSLLFSMLPGLVIAFLPRSKHLLISWLQSPSAVILELKMFPHLFAMK